MMKKSALCIPTALVWMVLLSPGQAQQVQTNAIPSQQQYSDSTSYPLNQPQSLQVKKDCDPKPSSAYRPSHPIRSIQSPTVHQSPAVPQRRPVRTAVWQDLRSHQPGVTPPSTSIELHESELPDAAARSYQTPFPKRPIIVEARGWTRDQQGRVYLTPKLRKYGAPPTDDGC